MTCVVSSGATSSGIILSNNSMNVLDGGTADNTTINSGSILRVE